MNHIILSSKLLVPEAQGLIHRPGLVNRLDQASLLPLTVIKGAAGYGKTSLVCDWLQQCPVDCCWVSLDKKNDIPSAFWSYVCASLKKMDQDVVSSTENLLRNLYIQDFDLVCDSLIDALNGFTRKWNRPARCVLVLDDFHVIQHPQILTSFARFLDYKPYWLQVVITTRVLPKLGMPQRLSKQKAVLIDTQQLAFTQDETLQLLQQRIGPTLDNETASQVFERSRGWPAAIQLMALAIESGVSLNDPNMSMQHEMVSDFLFEEVYLQLSDELKTSLQALSVVERFSPELAGALTQQEDADGLLNQLMESGLFISKTVEQDRVQYKVHDLFRTWLMAFSDARNKQGMHDYRQTAIAWLEQNQQYEDALYIAVDLQNWGQAALMMRHLFQRFLQNGNLDHLQSLLDVFPINEIIQRPHLSVLQALLYFCQYQHEQTHIYLDYCRSSIEQLEQSLEQDAIQPWGDYGLIEAADIQLLKSAYNVIESLMARFNGDEARLEQCQKDIDQWIDEDHPLYCWVLYGHFVDHFIKDDITTSVQLGKRALEQAKASGDAMCAVSVLSWYLHGLFHHGQVQYALKLGQEHLDWIIEGGLKSLPNISSFYCALCHLYIETFQLDKAWKYFHEVENNIHRFTEPREVLFTKYYLKYKLLKASGRNEEAQQWIAEIKEYEQSHLGYHDQHKPFSILPDIDIFEHLNQLAQGNAMPLIQWSMMPLDDTQTTVMKYEVERFIQLVGLSVAGQDTEDEINDAIENAHRHGVLSRCTSIRLFKLLYEFRQYESGEVSESFKQALQNLLAQSKQYGFKQLILDGGKEVPNILHFAISHGLEVNYCQSLLDKLAQPIAAPLTPADSSNTQAFNSVNTATPVPESDVENVLSRLTQREFEVLQKLATGIRNQEISDTLGISLATVKRHIQNIYGKLQVNTRTEAALIFSRHHQVSNTLPESS